MAIAYLMIGGNLGNRMHNLKRAISLLQQHAGKITESSSVYQTAAWGMQDQPDFLNQVLVLETALAPEPLMQTLLRVELEMGRIRDVKNGPRTMDIDILLYDQQVLHSPMLEIPHPRMALRRFVLEPMAEIAPNLVHPVENRTMTQLLQDCTDALDVKKIAV